MGKGWEWRWGEYKGYPKEQIQQITIWKETLRYIAFPNYRQQVVQVVALCNVYIFSFESLINRHILTSETKATDCIYRHIKSHSDWKENKVK